MTSGRRIVANSGRIACFGDSNVLSAAYGQVLGRLLHYIATVGRKDICVHSLSFPRFLQRGVVFASICSYGG